MAKLPDPLRAVQIGPVWRAERPQRGRYRQFTQCDIDILGVASEIAEIELILATTEALGALGLEGLTVRINDRRLLAAMATWCGFAPERHASVFITLDKWDKLPPGEIRQELEQAGHPAAAVARMLELYAGSASARSLAGMRSRSWATRARTAPSWHCRASSRPWARRPGGRFRIDFDPTLVRGMGYYTGPIFEIRSSSFAAGSIAGGGRYDGMIGRMLGRDVPATGFSIGFERVVDILGRIEGRTARDDRRIALLFDEAAQELGARAAGGAGAPGPGAASWRSSARRGTRARSAPRWRSRDTRASRRSVPGARRACSGSPTRVPRQPGSRT